MDDTGDTFEDESNASQQNSDPLGIIGWEIGGKYKITAHIGGGGFGEVYEGYNINLTEQRLVFKFCERVQSRDKFAKEANILCLLDHPNICRVIDYLPEEGALVVPYISGRDGARILRDSGPLPEGLFLRVARDLSVALAFAHKQKVAHRDVKPGNILIDKNDHVYLIDFGIAKEVGDAATRTAYQALTPQFAAPERQAGDIKYDPFKSDIYEFGVTLFNFATNNMPYRNPANPNVREWGGIAARNLSPRLLKILKKATHPDPAARYESANDMVADIAGLKIAYRRPSKAKWVIPVAVVAVLAIAAFFGSDYIKGLFKAKTTSRPAITETQKPPDDIAPPIQKPKPDSVATDSTDKKPLSEKPKPRPKPEPKPVEKPVESKPVPKPPDTVFRVNINPSDGVSLSIDGKKRPIGRFIDIKRGKHSLRIFHRDYPVLRKEFRISEDTTTVTYNLNNEFSDIPLIDLTLAPSPLIDNYTLAFSLNGRTREFNSFPVRGLKRLAGEWEVEFSLFPTQGGRQKAVAIDSCVTFPWGGGPRVIISKGSGTINFGVFAEEGVSSVPLMIYWSEN